MKKTFLSIIIIVLFITGCDKSPKTIEEITGISFDDISYIKVDDSSDYDKDEFIKNYKKSKYKSISGPYGSTKHIYYTCYDSNGSVLFTLVDIGNNNKVFIKKGKLDNEEDKDKYLYKLDE